MNVRVSSRLSLILLLWVFVILIALGIFIFFTVRINDYQEKVNQGEIIITAFLIELEEQPLGVEVFFYYPLTNKGALLNVPEETGALVQSLNRVDTIESLYEPGNPQAYLQEVENLMGIKLDFYILIDREGLIRFIDYLEGIEVFLPTAVSIETPGEMPILLPTGSVTLDGDKGLNFLEYRDGTENIDSLVRREHDVVVGLLTKLSGLRPLEREAAVKYIYPLLKTSFDSSSFASFLEEMTRLNTDRIVLQQVLGTTRIVGGKALYFPHYEGRLLRETVMQIQDALFDLEILKPENLVVSIEIQNGTTENGLAGRTAQVFSSYGYNVTSIKNADSNQYENTVILDKKGDAAMAKRVANLIKAERIHTDIDSSEDDTVDIVVILGRDFDGRYVR